MTLNSTTLIITIIVSILIVFSGICLYNNPKYGFYPVNCMLYEKRKPIYNRSELLEIFPEAVYLEQNYKKILKDVLKLPCTENYLDRYGLPINTKEWKTIPLKLFNRESKYLEQMPHLKDLNVASIIVSVMEPGKVIEPHQGPYQGLIRYQLPLVVPDGDAYLHVDGKRIYWKEGQSLLFDESYTHGAVNKTKEKRIVLLIDLNRPFSRNINKSIHSSVMYILKNLPSTSKNVQS